MSPEVGSGSTQPTQCAAEELRTSPLATCYLVIDGVGYKGEWLVESQGRSRPQAEVKEVPDHSGLPRTQQVDPSKGPSFTQSYLCSQGLSAP